MKAGQSRPSPNPVVVDGAVAEILMDNGSIVTIDAEDVDRVRGVHWHYVGGYCAAYMNGKKSQYLHRLLGPAAPKVDHRDRDVRNCRKGNLRACTDAQSSANRGMQSNNHTGVKGVFFDRWRGKYVASVQKDGRSFFRKRFDTMAEATEAYDREARRAFGEFAVTNASIQNAG